MSLGKIEQASSGQSGVTGGQPARASDANESRALVAVAPAAPAREAAARYHQASFLAQLLAVKDQHPQTRARRRATPHEAIAAYRSMAALTGR